MKNLLSTPTGKILVIGILAVSLLALGFWKFGLDLVVPLLITILVFVTLWLAIDLGLKAWKQRKQSAFDDGVAAKEGIEDRQQEWRSWTNELKKQGIDRYALPMYLLVGEPQSGKSILLQNSDLHFPFGQSRLSGVGGTRGCDWWFTEEAVILDLAGRLFTHEGGASDEAEWGAFLDMMAEFRPLCPANGVLLVLPCDALLADDKHKAAEKANKMQGALVTLTSKLQARMPVYVILTKGDKVFGFAECVHRLESDKRHEMFGWSRPADEAEAPFQLEDVKHGFDEIVARARLLRSEMLSTARIPEAIPEIDRLYAFPDELASVYAGLETYLQRVFSESSLVDRLFFRGLYLTSGLQTGAPIAKVCSELIGGGREADERNLEALFTRQRAYFIKDLARKRIFAEKGLVRPTQRRAVTARRNATIGYGVSAAIAIAAVLFSVLYLSGERSDIDEQIYQAALESAERAAADIEDSIPAQLAVLSRVQKAIEVDPRSAEHVFQKLQDDFTELYREIFDTRLLPSLRRRAEETVANELRVATPQSFASFEQAAQDAALLLRDMDLSDDASAKRLLGILPDAYESAAPRDGLDTPVPPFTLSEAIAARNAAGGETPISVQGGASHGVLGEILTSVGDLWDGTLTPGRQWQVRDQLGFVIALKGLEESRADLGDVRLHDPGPVRPLCAVYAVSLEVSDKCAPSLGDDGELRYKQVREELDEHVRRHSDFFARLPGEADVWGAAESIREYVDQRFHEDGVDRGGSSIALIDRVVDLSDVVIPEAVKKRDKFRDDGPEVACGKYLVNVDWAPEELPKGVRDGFDALAKLPTKPKELGLTIFRAKCKLVQDEYRDEFPRVGALVDRIDGEDLKDGEYPRGTLAHLVDLYAAVHRQSDSELEAWEGHLENLMYDACHDWDPQTVREIDPEVVRGLSRVAAVSASRPNKEARLKLRQYLDGAEDELRAHWSGQLVDSKADIETLLKGVEAHLELLAAEDVEPFVGDHVSGKNHASWLRGVDALVASRLRDALKEARASSRIPTAFSDDVGRAAEQVTEIIDNLELQTDVSDLKGNAFVRAVREPERLSVLPKTYRDFLELSVRLDPGSVSGDIDTLRDVAGELERFDSQRSDRGKVLARSLRRLARDEEARAKLSVIVDELETKFRAALRAAATRALRADLVEVLARRDVRDVTKAIWPDEEEIDEIDKNLGKGLGELFDAGKALDDLLEKYELVRAEGDDPVYDSSLLRPEATAEAPKEERETWAWVDFLAQLSVFLRQDQQDVDQSGVDVRFEPRNSDPASIWRAPKSEGGLPVVHYPISQTGKRGSHENTLGDPKGHNLTWDFSKGTKTMAFGWSRGITFDRGRDPTLELRSQLAPLILAWMGEPEDSDDVASQNWEVAPIPEGSRLEAPMIVSFDRPLPVRPDGPPEK